jgi:hypothetical protein
VAGARAAGRGGWGSGWNGNGWGQGGAGTVVLYENDNFGGRSIDLSQGIDDLQQRGFNDRVSSLVIRQGLWEFCSDADFRGQCITLGPGRYPTMGSWNLNDKLSSVRRVTAAASARRSSCTNTPTSRGAAWTPAEAWKTWGGLTSTTGRVRS